MTGQRAGQTGVSGETMKMILALLLLGVAGNVFADTAGEAFGGQLTTLDGLED